MAGPSPTDWSVDPSVAGARQLAPDLWRLRLPMPWLGIDHANAWVVGRGDELVLFDCGTAGHPSNEAALDVAFAAAGLRLDDVALFVGTHAHSDHIGLAGYVVERAGCEFWGHPDTGPLYDGLRDPEGVYAQRVAFSRREGAPDEVLPACGDIGEEVHAIWADLEPTRALADGDAVPTSRGDFRVIATPGHAPSHLSFFHEPSSTLVVGDAVGPAFQPWFDLAPGTDPFADWQRSLERLDALGAVDVVLPGHGRPIADLPAIVAMHRDTFAARLESVTAALADGPATAWDLTLRLFGTPDPLEQAFWRFDEALALLRHLHVTGRVVREVRDDRALHRLAS